MSAQIFSPLFYMKEQLLSNLYIFDYKFCILYWVYIPFCQERHFLLRSRSLQSQMAGLLLHTMFRLQERKVWPVSHQVNCIYK